MIKRPHILVQIFAVVTLLVAAALAFEITPVGTVDDDLFAPTSLFVSADELAVLEPYSQQLKIFSASGVMTHEVYLTGDAYGLTKISRYLYLYCDRDRSTVVAINAVNGAQFDYFSDITGLDQPIDLLVKDSSICILNAGNSSIFVLSESSGNQKQIPLVDADGDPIKYFNSFAYDRTNDRYYLLDQVHSKVIVVGSDGHQINTFSQFGKGEGEISRGGEIAIDATGRVYVTDRYQGIVTVFRSDGEYIGQIDAFGGTVAVPTGIAIDESGVLYVASTMGAGIRMFFVSAAPSLDQSVAIVQRYPDDAAILAVKDVHLAAQARLNGNENSVTGFDFQLFSDTLESPVTQQTAIEPVIENGATAEEQLLSADWKPESGLSEDGRYHWRIRVRDGDELGQWSDFRLFSTAAIPLEYHLQQNYPNPFNPSTQISFTLPTEVEVTVVVYNMLGQTVATLVDETLPTGSHTVVWDGTDDSGQAVATGVYFYRLQTDEFSQSLKMVLIK